MREDLAEEGVSASLNRVARLLAADGQQGWPGAIVAGSAQVRP